MSPGADPEIAFAGPLALAALVRQKAVSPRELVELFLGRIAALDPRLNAFRTVIAEEAMAGADAMTDLRGPLAGVPIAIKDDVAVAGQSATRGSRSRARLARAGNPRMARPLGPRSARSHGGRQRTDARCDGRAAPR